LIPVDSSCPFGNPHLSGLSSQADDTFGPDYGFLDVLWVLSEDLHGLASGRKAGGIHGAKNLCLIYTVTVETTYHILLFIYNFNPPVNFHY
jgi:hypothetical protein